MTRRSLAMQIALTTLLFAAYLAFYAVLDGAGLNAQREGMIHLFKQVGSVCGLLIAGVAIIWATLVSIFDPGNYQIKLTFVTIIGLAMWFYL